MGLIDAFSWESEGCIKRRTLFGLTPEMIKSRMLNSVWPDALIKLKAGKNEGTYSLEFEHSVKAQDRRHEKIRSYWQESSDNAKNPTLFIYSNSQVERAYAENFKEFFNDITTKKDRADCPKTINELEKLFFRQVFMVANYSEVREKYEKFLGGKRRSTIEMEAICSLEPKFLEIRERVKKTLLAEKMEKERVAENERLQEIAESEKRNKSLFGRHRS